MEIASFANNLAGITAGLRPVGNASASDLQRLNQELASSIAHQPAASVLSPASVAGNFNKIAVEKLPLQKLQNLQDIAGQVLSARIPPAASATQFKAFERTVPVVSPFINDAVPDWARGAKIDHTIGPFIDANGVKKWYDFYPIFIQQQIRIFTTDVNQPLLILTVYESIFFKQSRQEYKLAAGSLWISAKSLSGSINTADAYCGIKIKGGVISFSKMPNLVGKDLQIDNATEVGLTIQPDPNIISTSDPNTGLDATKATLNYFTQVSFHFISGVGKISGNTPGNLKVYGTSVDMNAYDASGQIAYSIKLGGLFIQFTTSAKTFSFTTVLSTFCNPDGSGQILETGWFLPVSLTPSSQLGAASGTGSLGIVVSKGANIQWKGLQNGPVSFSRFILLAEPGLLTITGAILKNPLAGQKLILWEEDSTKKRFSTFSLSFPSSGEISFTASSQGIELINTTVIANADVDRPLAANGNRIQLKSTQASFFFIDLKNIHEVLLYDFNLLQEQQNKTPAPLSIDLHNAFFIVTQPEAFLLTGVLPDDLNISRGNLGLLFGVKNVFLTLPDPYVSNQLLLSRDLYSNRGTSDNITGNNALLLLMSFVTWKSQDAPSLDFKIAPQNEQAVQSFLKTFLSEEIQNVSNSAATPQDTGATTVAGYKAVSGNTFSTSLSNQFTTLLKTAVKDSFASTFHTSQLPESELATKAVMEAYRSVYNQLLQSVLQPGQVMLLDVSGNADQLGVSFSFSKGLEGNIRGAVANNAVNAAAGLPFQAQGLDVVASGKYARLFTLPNNQWEPVKNIPNPDADPPGFPNPIIFPNDGGPTIIATANQNTVALVPKKMISFIESSYNDKTNPLPAAGYYTLPFGMIALSFFNNKTIQNYPMASLGFNQPEFLQNVPDVNAPVSGGIQLKTTSFRPAPDPKIQDPYFYGFTWQIPDLGWDAALNIPYGILGPTVGYQFNREFFWDPMTNKVSPTHRVPLKRIDFSGYGASIFSNWLNPNANFGLTSQTKFDVLIGRTAHEVVQIKSIIYPWGINVVRTITIQRTNNAKVTRYDSGWQAQGTGVYDFSYRDQSGNPHPNPYTFHPGIIRGMYNVREIKDTDQRFPLSYYSAAVSRTVNVQMQGVYFDADVNIDFVKEGAQKKSNGLGGEIPLVLSRRQFGFVLLGDPEDPEPLPTNVLRNFLKNTTGPLGGPVDCVVNIGNSGQLMRINRVDVDASDQASGAEFVTSSRGTVLLPKDGSWGVALHNKGSDQVTPIPSDQNIPLIRQGTLNTDTQVIDPDPNKHYRIADPVDLSALTNPLNEYAFLQTTGTQKLLFLQPSIQNGVKELKSLTPSLADAYRLVNSKSIFPNVADCISLPNIADIGNLDIIAEGLKFKNAIISKLTDFIPTIPNSGRFDIINTPAFKIYILYQNPENSKSSSMSVDLDSAANAGGARKKWETITKDVSMVVDLGPFSPLLTVTGQFNASFGETPGFSNPQIKLNDALEKIKEILQLLASLSTDPDYLEIIKEGMQIAMSNSPESWDYKFHAVQDIPVIKFPTTAVEDAGPPPLKLEAGLKLGFYFNETLKPTTDISSLLPSSGAFVEFYGKLSVMVLSLEVATIYAVGTTTLKVSADTTQPVPALDFKFGFGAEIVVQLPVIAKVSVSFLVTIEIDINNGTLAITAGFLYKGVADILDGLVTVTIYIEAHGSIIKKPGETDLQGDVTFGLDISIFLVIDISFSKTWQETRQIA